MAAVFGWRAQSRDGVAASADGAPRLLASLRANSSRLCLGSRGDGSGGVVPGRLGGKVPWGKKSMLFTRHMCYVFATFVNIG